VTKRQPGTGEAKIREHSLLRNRCDRALGHCGFTSPVPGEVDAEGGG